MATPIKQRDVEDLPQDLIFTIASFYKPARALFSEFVAFTTRY